MGVKSLKSIGRVFGALSGPSEMDYVQKMEALGRGVSCGDMSREEMRAQNREADESARNINKELQRALK